MAGSIPSGAVFTRISSTGRNDFVCQYRGSAGFYNPRMGCSCHYPFKGRERLGSPFQILVKTNSSEDLTWRSGSWGRVPNNSVTACSGGGVYVGRNRGGLGTVSVGLKAFRLPRNHREYRFRSYQVLTFN
ncbi:natterin-3-like [Notolabrus celidotus]|uniref:natterin-3-like n=1 Tax=Notolabrus celidotus TaxID=1203425 RepID=UPI00148FB5AD|nr:natterin-3-like [Notolabrus celidotus]